MSGRPDASSKTLTDVSLMRDGLRSQRGRVRFLFSMSGFVMICVAMVMVPVAVGISSMIFGEGSDPDNARIFLGAALGLCTILLQLGIIFKLYADAIDHEIWYYSLVGSAPATDTTAKGRFLKLCTMAFISLGALMLIWGILAPTPFPPVEAATLVQGNEHHFVDLSRQALSDKSHRLAVLALLMAILSLQYFNQVKREELRALSTRE